MRYLGFIKIVCRHNSLPIDPPAPVIQTEILLFMLAFNNISEGLTLGLPKISF